ncbi:hypothetical protein ACFV0O_05925 [Kitasatospora sp. NPDC059577]|uniref:hypothetical protein n=1 Tax=Kitasatospora sp. NPDC059577 TaxID=3346873 RepID=UPI003684C13E
MTDKLHRRSGGDGDEPAETPTERLLREALGARAALVTANSLRPAAPPKHRIRRLRPVYTVAVPFGLAAAMALGVLTFHGEPVAHDQVPPPAATLTAAPSPSPTAEPTPTPSATPTDTGTPTGDPETEVPLADGTPTSSASATNTAPPVGPSTPYTFRGVKFKVPAGWKAVPTADNTLCVMSPGAPTQLPQGWTQNTCEPYGVMVTAYNTQEDVDAGGWPKLGFMDTSSGWSSQPYCPVWDNPHAPTGEAINSTGPVKSTPTVSGRSALKSQWQATCGKSAFTAQVWALPKDQVFVSAVGLKSDYQAGLQSIVNSLDVSGHKAPGAATPSADPVTSTTVAVTQSGFLPGGMVSAKDGPVTFSVTYRNTGTANLPSVQPLVFTDPYPGTPDSPIPMNAGKLERQDGGAWTQLSMSPGSGMDYATGGKSATFPLAPGASRTVTYRLTVDPADGPGIMPVRMQATLPYDGSGRLTVIGEAIVRENVVK